MKQTNFKDPEYVVRTAQIVVFSVAAGAFVFAIVAFVVQGMAWKPFQPQAMISMIMAAASISIVVPRFVLPGIMAAQMARRIVTDARQENSDPANADPASDARFGQAYLTAIITSSALLEGGAFLNLVAFLLEGQLYSLILGGVLLLGILTGFPTRASYDVWRARQQRRIEDIRSMPSHRV